MIKRFRDYLASRRAAVKLFEPVALQEKVTNRELECIAVFEAALARWRQRDWDDAMRLFEQCAGLERDQPGASPELTHNPSTYYLAIARESRANSNPGP